MSRPLRADTQVIVTVGPFMSVADGVTPVTTVTLAAMDQCELIKHGASSVTDISGATWAALAGCDGYYSLTLTTSHTDTEGQFILVFQDSNVFLPVRFEFAVLNAVAFDALYAAATTDYLQVDVRQWLGQAVTADSNVPEVHVVGLDDGVIAAAKLGADCITSAKIADDAFSSEHFADGAIAAAVLGADCITSAKIADDAIGPEHIGSGAIVADTLAADCITAAKIADDAIATEHLATGAITADTLASSCITAAKLGDDCITNSKIADDAIAAENLATDCITNDAIASATDLTTTMKASVNTEVVDVMTVDTHSEPSQGAPPAAPTKLQMMQYPYVGWRNKKTQTSTEQAVYDDAGTTKLVKATVSDDDTTTTLGEYGTGA